MKIMEGNKITSKLFYKDIRSGSLNKDFKEIFKIEIAVFLSEYDYDEIDEFPIEIDNTGIMIGFIAETVKVPPQIEYIDLDICNYPQNINYLTKTIPQAFNLLELENIKEYLTSYSNLIIYYSLYNIKQIDRIVFQHEDLRYELLLNKDFAISRVRICSSDNESNVNMRTYYPFGKS